MENRDEQPTVGRPTITLLEDWRPVGPSTYEVEYRGYILRVFPSAPNPGYWAWTAHFDGALVASGTQRATHPGAGDSDHWTRAMYRALTYVGHPWTLSEKERREAVAR